MTRTGAAAGICAGAAAARPLVPPGRGPIWPRTATLPEIPMPRLAALALLLPLALAPGASAGPLVEVVSSQQARFAVVALAEGLENPSGMAFLPPEAGGGVLIAERRGRLRLFRDGRLGPPLDGVPQVAAIGDGGLLDVALHPDFAETRWVYLGYAARGAGGYGTRVARARLEGERLSELQVIYDMGERTGSARHFGARLAFGADGRLFVALGERGDPERAQDPADTAGSILRLTDAGAAPPDNPFLGRRGHDARIYAYGLRDPQGLAVDPRSGAVWAHEHGPRRGGDELNRILPGGNYGWPRVSLGIGSSAAMPGGSGMVEPRHLWNPAIGPSGLALYQGAAFPDWQGDLLAGALEARALVRLELEEGQVVGEERLLQDGLGRIRDVGVGPDGLVYLLAGAGDGALYRLEPPEQAAPAGSGAD